MKVGFLNYYTLFNNNNMFKNPSVHKLSDDLLYPYVYLYETAKLKGIEISTIDSEPLESYDLIFFIDFPTVNNEYFRKLIETKSDNLILIIYEPEIVMPDNYDHKNYRYFKKIYTWNDEIVDNEKIFKYYSPIKIPKDFEFRQKEKLCTLIASNKFNYHPLELYSKRNEAIRWFEKNHPEDFDLYGYGWDQKANDTLANVWWTPEHEKRRNARPDEKPYTSYKGTVHGKIETLKDYKFSICYENARDIPGYITEKIFDSFFAGCIPIYWGAPNIKDYIPPETFIDRKEFDSYSELYSYIKNMPENTYQTYLTEIKRYITGSEIYPFGAENFADTIIKEIEGHKNDRNIFYYLITVQKSLIKRF
jgi:hypothetical protein